MLILLMWSVRSRGCFRSTKPNSRGTSINTIPLSVSGCAHSPLFQERFFPSRLLLLPHTCSRWSRGHAPPPFSPFLRFHFIFCHPQLICFGAWWHRAVVQRKPHPDPWQTHTPSCNCNVCADRKCFFALSLSHTHTSLLHNLWTSRFSADN